MRMHININPKPVNSLLMDKSPFQSDALLNSYEKSITAIRLTVPKR